MFRCRTAYILIIVSLLSTHIICARSAAPAESGNPADPPAASSPWSEGDPPSVPWSRMAYGGAFVLAVGMVALYLWKRRGLPAGRTAAEVIESRPVDAEMSVHLLKVGDRVFIVASTGEAVQKIGEVQEDEVPEPDAGDGAADESHFRTVLQTVLGRQQ